MTDPHTAVSERKKDTLTQALALKEGSPQDMDSGYGSASVVDSPQNKFEELIYAANLAEQAERAERISIRNLLN